MSARAARPRGFTLVEVMVAVFVMTVGLLGIAALQITSKQTNFEALQRMTASQLAQEMLERIRANPEQLAVYTNNGAGRKFDVETLAEAGAAAPCNVDPVSNMPVNCLASQIAEFDLYEISLAISGVTEQASTGAGTPTGGLLSPWMCIEGPATAPGNVTVAVAWRGATALGSTPAHACGEGMERYDSADGVAGVYRRVLSVDIYLE